MTKDYPLYTSPEVGDFDKFDYYCKYCDKLMQNGDEYDGEYYDDGLCRGFDLWHVGCYEDYHKKQREKLKVETG